MAKNVYSVGLDIACDDFVASIYQSPKQSIITKEGIENTFEGFNVFILWLKEHGLSKTNCIVCMEATGVYNEAIAHYLVSQGFRVSVEPPLKVKRAFDPVGHKTDAVDSKQIAEYAYRYSDELRFWQPKDEIIEKIKHLLTAREQFTKQSTAIKNAMKSYEKHVVQVSLIVKAHRQTLREIKKHITEIDKELDRIIRQNPSISNMNNQLKSIPGFGLLLSASLITLTGAFSDISRYKTLAAFLGIYRQPHMRSFGPAYPRKLLNLAARSVATHNDFFKKYYARKLAEGKAKQLVLNNIANKLIKLACALIKNNSRYTVTYRSINPMFLNIS